jgi:hypothetical protein
MFFDGGQTERPNLTMAVEKISGLQKHLRQLISFSV